MFSVFIAIMEIKATKRTVLFFFVFIRFAGTQPRFSPPDQRADSAGTIRLELSVSAENAIQKLKWIGRVRGDRRRMRWTSKPARGAAFI